VKGARPAATKLLSTLIRDVLQHPLSTSSWSKLLGGKSRNLTKRRSLSRLCEYDHGVVKPPPELPSPRHTMPLKKKSHDEAMAMLASVKLEDGDVKGAVRLLSSDYRLSSPDETTFDELRRLPPADRRSELLRMSHRFKFHLHWSVRLSNHFPIVQRLAQTVFGHNIVKIYYLVLLDDNQLLSAVTPTYRPNEPAILEGKTPLSVRVPLFGAKLLAIRKYIGGIRPIAVGYVWRRLTAKVANHLPELLPFATSTLSGPSDLQFGDLKLQSEEGAQQGSSRTAELMLL